MGALWHGNRASQVHPPSTGESQRPRLSAVSAAKAVPAATPHAEVTARAAASRQLVPQHGSAVVASFRRVVSRTEVSVEGRPAYVWTGGSGDEPLLLLHGAWAGAELHWGPVWDQLAGRFRVVAPDFPGLAYEAAWVPRSFDESVRWLEAVLTAMGIDAAWAVGNSFGGALAARLASQEPARCLGLVLVNGPPAPRIPAAVSRLLRSGPLRWLVDGISRRNAYSSSALRRAFAEPDAIPAELSELARQRRPRQLKVTGDIVLAGDEPVPPPSVRTLLLWGADDHLMGTSAKTAERLARSLPQAELVLIPRAGHLPQVERPEEFVRALVGFAG